VWMVISTVLTKMLCTMYSFVQVGGYVIFDDVYTWRDAGICRRGTISSRIMEWWKSWRASTAFLPSFEKARDVVVDFTKMRPSRVLTSMDWCAADLRTHCQQKMIVRIFSLVGYITQASCFSSEMHLRQTADSRRFLLSTNPRQALLNQVLSTPFDGSVSPLFVCIFNMLGWARWCGGRSHPTVGGYQGMNWRPDMPGPSFKFCYPHQMGWTSATCGYMLLLW
jgi:hypothetical protein